MTPFIYQLFFSIPWQFYLFVWTNSWSSEHKVFRKSFTFSLSQIHNSRTTWVSQFGNFFLLICLVNKDSPQGKIVKCPIVECTQAKIKKAGNRRAYSRVAGNLRRSQFSSTKPPSVLLQKFRTRLLFSKSYVFMSRYRLLKKYPWSITAWSN